MRTNPELDTNRSYIMWIVREIDSPMAVHLHTYSKERGLAWIEEYGDSGMFMNKTLRRTSFEVCYISK